MREEAETVSVYTEIQLDALRELANVGSGTAGIALSGLVCRPIDISVPVALALPLAEAVDALGDAADRVTGVALPVAGDLDAAALLLFGDEEVAVLCGLLGVAPATELGQSALAEVGNVVCASYVGALSAMTCMTHEPGPPVVATERVGTLLASAMAPGRDGSSVALVLDTNLRVEGERCDFTFVLLPTAAGVGELLMRLGVGS